MRDIGCSASTISCLLIPCMIAWRTWMFCSGSFDRLKNSVLNDPGTVMSKSRSGFCAWICGTQPGARTPSIMSTSPEISASVRAVVSAM